MTKSGWACVVSVALAAFAARAENWPNWRGPFYNGSTSEANLPETLDKTKNLAWVCALPGVSAATPAVWGGRVFVSSADKAGNLLGICVSRKDGKVLWQKTLSSGDRNPQQNKNNLASPSPVTDGQIVVFLFGTGTLAALDNEGKVLWTRELDLREVKYGYSSSPVLYRGRLYVEVLQHDPGVYVVKDGAPRPSYLLALDPRTGKELFRHVRLSDAVNESREAYNTPLPHEFDGKAELVVAGGDCVTGHDLETGAELWRFGGWNPGKQGNWRLVPSAVAGAGMIFFPAPRGTAVYAIKAGGAGDISATQRAWKFTESAPDVCTPLFYQDRLYVLTGERKLLTCHDPATGAKKWQGNLGGLPVFDASPTAADGKIYCINETGEVVILAAGDEFKILSRVMIEEGGRRVCAASIAIAQGCVFVRTPANLWCFKK